jgi:ATP-dependent Clp protease ATP-binding subunit ClpA
MTSAPEENGFPHVARALMARSLEEAALRGSNTVEAEHLLLALTADPASAASTALVPFGLDHDRIEAALAEERTRSLAFAGVGPVDPARLVATPHPRTRPAWGASIREAMGVMRRITPRGRQTVSGVEVTLLVAILSADLGTVPRALAIADVDRQALLAGLTPRP